MNSEQLHREDNLLDIKIRPHSLTEFIGHEKITQRLKVLLDAAKERSEPLDHILFYGPPGLGKTSLANILAQEMETKIYVTSGTVIEKSGDLAGILTNLNRGDILFIDEIHRLKPAIEEYLYPAIENFSLDLMLDSGPSARSVQVTLEPFTLVGATTRIGSLTAALRSRIHSTIRLEYYSHKSLAKIITRTAKLLGVSINNQATEEIAKRARRTPRIANNMLRWIRDVAQLKYNNQITLDAVQEASSMVKVDHLGLDEIDQQILKVIIENYQGGPVGLKSIAATIGEDPLTIEEVIEPYLIMEGMINRTPRGRQATPKAYKHLNITYPNHTDNH